MIFAAMYLLMMVGKVVFGPLKEPVVREPAQGRALPPDLCWREIGVLIPLAVLCLYLGFQPKPVTDAAAGSIETMLSAYPQEVRRYVARESADG